MGICCGKTNAKSNRDELQKMILMKIESYDKKKISKIGNISSDLQDKLEELERRNAKLQEELDKISNNDFDEEIKKLNQEMKKLVKEHTKWNKQRTIYLYNFTDKVLFYKFDKDKITESNKKEKHMINNKIDQERENKELYDYQRKYDHSIQEKEQNKKHIQTQFTADINAIDLTGKGIYQYMIVV